MNLPRHAIIYVMLVGLLSVIQLILGADLVVLAAIDTACLFALYPLSKRLFGPNDLLFLSFCFYYGFFSLTLKTLVLQSVQTNLKNQYVTSAYLVAGMVIIFSVYFIAERFFNKFYPNSSIRQWTVFEKNIADEGFLKKFTLPFSIATLALLVFVAIFSNGALEIFQQKQEASSVNTLSSLIPLVQLSLAMQLALITQYKDKPTRTLALISLTVAVFASVITNHKVFMFLLAVTLFIHIIAFRIRLRPRVIAGFAISVILLFFYLTPLIHIERSLQIEKSAIFDEAISILVETDFNPIELQVLEQRLLSTGSENDLTAQIDYLAPYNLTTDRFTLLMPIDQIDRHDDREPLGTGELVHNVIKEVLPKAIVGQHELQNTADEIAWRFSIREQGQIARPALGLLGSGLGIEGSLGLLLYGPVIILILCSLNKLFCNGSIWQNPFGIFMASRYFFAGEMDFSSIVDTLRGFLPMMAIAYLMIFIHKYVK